MSFNHPPFVSMVQKARQWYQHNALPFWADEGWDHDRHGFYDKIDQSGRALDVLPKRCRVQARQIFCLLSYPTITGENRNPYEGQAEKGLDFLLRHYQQENGGVISTLDENNYPLDLKQDNYDQAFTLFALGHGYRALANQSYLAAAHRLLGFLKTNRQHPQWGFWETSSAQPPMLTNPHMHFVEAFLVLAQADPDGPWLNEAGNLIQGLINSVICPSQGLVFEYADQTWDPLLAGKQGRIEPGHLFEWATLLQLYSSLSNDDSLIETAKALYHTAAAKGLDPVSGRVYSALAPNLAVTDSRARFWPHTEKLKASVMMARLDLANQDEYLSSACESWSAIESYFNKNQDALWVDWFDSKGKRIMEPAPASSFYHVVNAIISMTSNLPLTDCVAHD